MKSVQYYQLEKVTEHQHNGLRIRTAAVLMCALCQHVIDGMGGPGSGVLCVPCGDALKTGQLRLMLDKQPQENGP
jgi:hypothetical protein